MLEDTPPEVQRLRRSVRYLYDLQRLRIQSGNRNSRYEPDGSDPDLGDDEKEFLGATSKGLQVLEQKALREVRRALREVPVWRWLKDQKGVGPAMAGVLVSEVDIRRAQTPSALWRYCGLAVDSRDGRAERRRKKERLHYNPWLKSKVLEVLGSSFLRSSSPWREHYDNYKHRKQSTMVDKCMRCHGAGTVQAVDEEARPTPKTVTEKSRKKPKKDTKCHNCDGTGGPCVWGESDRHRHRAALRYMVKMFLLELWKAWRTLEGLPLVPDYAQAKLGRTHGEHQSLGAPVAILDPD